MQHEHIADAAVHMSLAHHIPPSFKSIEFVHCKHKPDIQVNIETGITKFSFKYVFFSFFLFSSFIHSNVDKTMFELYFVCLFAC